MTDFDIPARMIPFVWYHEDVRPGRELPKVEWCRWNFDGSFYVDWDRCHHLANDPVEPPNDLLLLNHQIMARLLLSARGKFSEVSLVEADRIAEDCAARCPDPRFSVGIMIDRPAQS